jgi:hypothetical protein
MDSRISRTNEAAELIVLSPNSDQNNPGFAPALESTPQTALFGVKAPLRALIRAGNGSK